MRAAIDVTIQQVKSVALFGNAGEKALGVSRGHNCRKLGRTLGQNVEFTHALRALWLTKAYWQI